MRTIGFRFAFYPHPHRNYEIRKEVRKTADDIRRFSVKHEQNAHIKRKTEKLQQNYSCMVLHKL